MPLLATRAAASARGFGFAGGSLKFMVATGGTITQDGSFQIHTFTSGGTFEVTQLATDPANDVVQYLLSAGGGGAGSAGSGPLWGAGGAGGCKTESGQPVTTQTYPISVGGGGGHAGAGGSSGAGANGGAGGGAGGGDSGGDSGGARAGAGAGGG